MKVCQEQECDSPHLARGLCRTHYNRIYWTQIASEATLQNRDEGIRRNLEARKLPGYVPRAERPKLDPIKKKMRIARQAALRRHMIRDIINQIKVLEGCIDCGYNAHAAALDFDHQGNKKYEIARMVGSGRPVDILIEEIEKCVVRCSNCHRVKTWIHRADENIPEWIKPKLIGWEEYYYGEDNG